MLGTLIVGFVKRSLKISDQMHRKSNARIANATKTKEKHGTKCNHNCNMSHNQFHAIVWEK